VLGVSLLATVLMAQGALAAEQRERPGAGIIKQVIVWLFDRLSTPPG
jgi:hypothetical protein